MKGQYQTTDNCLSACLATILGIPIRRVPNFFADKSADEACEHAHEWLREKHSLDIVFSRSNKSFLKWVAKSGVIHIRIGPADPGMDLWHAVVYEGDRMVWDPAPFRGEKGPGLYECRYTILLVPLRPRANFLKRLMGRLSCY